MGIYCDAQDVWDHLQMDSALTNTSTPSVAAVEDFINAAEDTIDARTRHAWRPRRVVDEYHTARFAPGFRLGWAVPYVDLHHWLIRPLDHNAGDKLEIFLGNTYMDLLDPVNGKVSGRTADYFLEERPGRVYFPRTFPITIRFAEGVRVTYRYGEYDVPGNVHELAVMLAAAEVLRYTSRILTAQGGPQGPQNMKPGEALADLNAAIKEAFADTSWIQSPKKRWRITGGPAGR